MSLPQYGDWISVPKHLMTKTSLSKAGLSIRGLKPVAIKTGGYGPYDLYDSTQAKPKRAPSEKQLAVLEKGRLKPYTCPFCKKVQKWPISYIEHWGRMCHDCADKAFENYREEARLETQTWARKVLNDQAAIILDTETTGFGGVAIEIAIINMAGEVLLNTLIKNLEPIELGAQEVHGLSETDLTTAPTWAETWPRIEEIFNQAKRLVIYNATFDYNIIKNTNDMAGIKADLDRYKWLCAMDGYAKWYGEWSQKYGSFKWQALNGGHRALEDCRACLSLIKEMSKETA